MKVTWYFLFSMLFFLFRTHGKKNTWMRTKFFESAIKKVTWYQLCSKFFINIYEAHWQRHLKDILKLKILQQWINIRANSSLMNITKRKWTKGARKTISCTKVWACFMKSISLIIVFFFFSQTNLIFKYKLNTDRIIFTKIYLPFFLLVFCVYCSSFSASALFYKNQ